MAALLLRAFLAAHAHVPVVRCSRNGRPLYAIISRHQNDCLLIDTRFFQAGKQAAHVFIKVVDHAVEDRQLFIDAVIYMLL